MEVNGSHSDPGYPVFRCKSPFRLESGVELAGFHLAYTAFGRLNEQRDNVVWVFHALTANSDPRVWWPGLVGQDTLFDPAHYFIVCVNMPGSCYGSIGPLDVSQEEFSYHGFPFFTIHDMIMAYRYLREELGIRRIKVGIGGSMGGQQLLEWAVTEPELFEYIIPIATNAWHSAWGKAFNASQRWCIEADPSFHDRKLEAGMEGMKLARSVALLSYRHYQTYNRWQSDGDLSLAGEYRAASYQRHQGDKLARRFNAFSYHCLARSMDSHHVGRHAGGAAEALGRITAKTLVIGLRSDMLFPQEEQEYLAAHIPVASLSLIDSLYGHDGFLLEVESITMAIRAFFIQWGHRG